MPDQSERDLMLVVAGEDGWLADYLGYARQLTDAPLSFHLAAGLVALAGAVGSRVSWTGGGKEQWPNLYTLLLAPSGLYRKSTSVDLAAGLLERACPGVIMDREFSPERFLRNLAQHPTSVLKEAEFSSLLERMKQNYMGGFKNRLTELYDAVPEYGRHIQGGTEKGPGGDRLVIERPALSILAASTTDWLVQSITEMDLRSGFIPRFLFFPATEREAEPPGGYWSTADAYHERQLVDGLREVAHQPVRTHLNLAAVSAYLIDWARHTRADYDEVALGDLSGVFSRLDHNATKVLALLCVSELAPGREYVATLAQAERATMLIDWVRRATVRTFEEHLVFEKFEQLAQRCLRLLSSEWSDQRDVLRRLRIRSSEFRQLCETLRERGQIDTEQQTTGGRFRNVIRSLVTDVPEDGKSRDRSLGEVVREDLLRALDGPGGRA